MFISLILTQFTSKKWFSLLMLHLHNCSIMNKILGVVSFRSLTPRFNTFTRESFCEICVVVLFNIMNEYSKLHVLLFAHLQFGLRQLDLSLLSQLWTLNESIQDFRKIMQDQEDIMSPPSPSQSISDSHSISSGDDDESPIDMPNHLRMRTAPPPPPISAAKLEPTEARSKVV